MEEKIYEIIKDHEHDFGFGSDSPQRDIAKAILLFIKQEYYPKKFIKWINTETIDNEDMIRKWVYNKITIDELYQYWKIEIINTEE